MLNFPKPPTLNQEYPLTGAKRWKWSGNKWDLLSISETQVEAAQASAAAAAASAQTIGITAAFSSANPVVKDSVDATKTVRITCSALPTATQAVFDITKGGKALVDSDVDPTRSLYSQSNATNLFDYRVAGTQRWSPVTTGTQTLSISNWPVAPQKGELIIDVINGGAATLAFPVGSVFVTAGGLEVNNFASSGIVFPTSGRRRLLVWSSDAGATTFFKAV